MRRAALVACAIGALAAGAVTAALGSRSSEKPTPALAALPRPVTPAFTPGPARPLGPMRDVTRWAPVRRAAIARREPAAHAAPVARVETRTPEGTTNIVQVLGRRANPGGALWVKVGVVAARRPTSCPPARLIACSFQARAGHRPEHRLLPDRRRARVR